MPSLSISIIMVYILYNAFQMLDYNFCFIAFNFYDCNKTDMFLYNIILSKGINLNNLLLGLQKGESFTFCPHPPTPVDVLVTMVLVYLLVFRYV